MILVGGLENYSICKVAKDISSSIFEKHGK